MIFIGFRRGVQFLFLGLTIYWIISPQTALGSDVDCFERRRGINVTFENDLWGSGSDKHFTHGSRLSFVEQKTRRPDKPDCNEKEDVSFMDWVRAVPDNTFGRWLGFDSDNISLILGQSIFTPEDIVTPMLVQNDRPYAGWLYMGIGLIREEAKSYGKVFDTLELDLGVVGPASFAEDVQKRWHKVIDSPIPQGWGNQIDNEPGIMLGYERRWLRVLTPRDYKGIQVDFLPSVGATLGNVLTFGSMGAMVRLGVNLPKDFGPPRIQPGAQGSDFFQPGQGDEEQVRWYVFAGVEGRVVAYNIFLDGNTVAHSHQVDKKFLVGDFHVGFVLVVSGVRIAFSNVFRTEEFDGQGELDEFGSITLSYAW